MPEGVGYPPVGKGKKPKTKKRSVSKDAVKRRMGAKPVDTAAPSMADSTLDQLAVLSAMRNNADQRFR